ncbi:hypothetical protein K474DRAFT_1605514 [Panus rudis PR-1116 ss-1]|nr:hypothetical protein K474DRAFT_1605514 [Panus rudis PR-1116 ss-1]
MDSNGAGDNITTVSRRKVRGRRGGLQGLPKMPLELIFKVLSYLYPMDLLNLARTSKAFRQLLMSKHSAGDWLAARRNVPEMPNIPENISEPAFANLLFDSHCHVRVFGIFECLRSHIQWQSSKMEHPPEVCVHRVREGFRWSV